MGTQLQSSLTGLLVIRTKCFFVPITNVRLTTTEVPLTRTTPSPSYPDRYCFVRLTGVRITGTKFCPDNECPVNEDRVYCVNNSWWLKVGCEVSYSGKKGWKRILLFFFSWCELLPCCWDLLMRMTKNLQKRRKISPVRRAQNRTVSTPSGKSKKRVHLCTCRRQYRKFKITSNAGCFWYCLGNIGKI